MPIAPGTQINPHPTGHTGGVTLGERENNSTNNATISRHMILIDQMIAWSIANPGQPWSRCAIALGLSPAWVRMVANTDAFKARAAVAGDKIFQEVGIVGLRERIAAATEVVVDRIAEKAAVSESMKDLTDAADVLLGIQYGSGAGGGGSGLQQPPTHITVQQQIILEEKARIVSGGNVVTQREGG